MAPTVAQYRYRVRLVPKASAAAVDAIAPGSEGDWELVGIRTSTEGDQLSVYRLTVDSAA